MIVPLDIGLRTIICWRFLFHLTKSTHSFQIFLKVASNIHDGSGGLRQIQYDDVTDRGRYAARTRSASARSIEARNIFLPPDQRKVLGMSDNPDDDNDSVFTGKFCRKLRQNVDVFLSLLRKLRQKYQRCFHHFDIKYDVLMFLP